MSTLYIAWQDPETRLWHTVGQVTKENDFYVFNYTKGAKASNKFTYLGRMHDLNSRYVSTELFPLLANRVLGISRPEYPDYVRWLNFNSSREIDPVTLLGRSGGERATDNLCVYPFPEKNIKGEYELYFFSHGLRYLTEHELECVNKLKVGDKLNLREENENSVDQFALRLENKEPVKVGYCPRYLNRDLRLVISATEIKFNVERLNIDAPIQFRLLCRAVFKLPSDFKLFSHDEYLPLNKIEASV